MNELEKYKKALLVWTDLGMEASSMYESSLRYEIRQALRKTKLIFDDETS